MSAGESTPPRRAAVEPHAQLELLARGLGEALGARGWRVATAESCTGGWIAKAITDVAGSSRWFGMGWVTYSNEAKTGLLGVSSRVIAAEGAVSEVVVRAMAAAARERAGSDLAVAVSGVAGPGGGTPAKPVGLVWFAWASALGLEAESRHFDGDRDAVRRQSVAHALRGLITLAGRGVSGSGSQDDAGGTSASRPPRSGGDVST